MSSHPAPDPMAGLRRSAVEALTGNSSLRDGLPDAQAQALLDWALAQLALALPRAAVLPPDAAETWLDGWLTAVTGVMRGVSRLAPRLQQLPRDEASYQMERLLGFLQQLVGPVDPWPALEILANQQQAWAPENTFDRLMQLITQQGGEEE